MKEKFNDGIHDITNDVYHNSEGLSRSALWEFKRSPRHYWSKYLNPTTPEKKTPQMKLGEILHALVLEPDTFDKRYILEPKLTEVPRIGLLKDIGRDEYERLKRLRESAMSLNKTIYDLFEKEAAQGKEIVSREHLEEAKAMAASVLSDPNANYLFRGISDSENVFPVSVERSIYFTHASTGLQCKARPDAWIGSLVTDLKTVKDASYRAFERSAFGYGYFLQAAMIKLAMKSIDVHLEKFIFYCVEKTPSFPCVYYILDEEALEYGVKQFNDLMEHFARCLDQNKWDSYEPQTLYIPSYAKYED